MLVGGIPNRAEDEDVHVPFHFMAPSRYIFPPNPTAFASNLAEQHGKALLRQARRYVDDVRERKAEPGTLLEAMFPDVLQSGVAAERKDYFARTLVGVMHGFLPTTYGNFLSAVASWMADEKLWRLQQDLRAGGRVAVIEPDEDLRGVLSLGLEEGHTSSAPEVETEMAEAGYRLAERPDLLPVQIFLVFAPAP